MVHSSSTIHYARLIELLHGLEKIERLLADPAILDTHVRAHAGVNCLEGVGMIEAPRGVLIHHYKVDEKGAIALGQPDCGHRPQQPGHQPQRGRRWRSHFMDGNEIKEGMLNRVSAVVRAYDPCLSCSTHADGTLAMEVRLIGPAGEVLDRVE